MQQYKIEVQKRDISNKKSDIKALRHAGKIPGVYYSHDSKSSIAFTVDQKMLREALKSTSQVYKISVGGKDRDVIMKSIQYHPISEAILHIDLYGVKMDTNVSLKVPIVFVGQCEGVKAGGVLNQNLTELEVSCLPSNIPQNIEVDVSNLNIGDSIRLEDISTDSAITLVGDSELLIASVILPTKVEEETEEETLEDDALTDDSSDSTTDDESSDSQEEASD